jgi:chromosome segregation ATPase
MSLSVPLEYAITSDFLGEVAVNDLLETARQTRDRITKGQQELATLREQKQAMEQCANRAEARVNNCASTLQEIKTKVEGVIFATQSGLTEFKSQIA